MQQLKLVFTIIHAYNYVEVTSVFISSNAGEIIFKVLGLVELNEVQDVSKILVKALVLMTKQKQIEKVRTKACLIHLWQRDVKVMIMCYFSSVTFEGNRDSLMQTILTSKLSIISFLRQNQSQVLFTVLKNAKESKIRKRSEREKRWRCF